MERISDEILQTMKIKNIRSVVEHLFTDEETKKLSDVSGDADAYRAYTIELYNKYIDKVIEDEKKSNIKDEDATSGDPESPEKSDKKDADSSAEGEVIDPEVADSIELDLNTVYSLIVRDVEHHNGTISIGCEDLLAYAIRFPTGVFDFRDENLAKSFIDILRNIKIIPGLLYFSEDDRAAAIKNIKECNGLK